MSNYCRLLCVGQDLRRHILSITFRSGEALWLQPQSLLMASIVKMTYWGRFNADKQNHSTNYEGTVVFGLLKYCSCALLSTKDSTHDTMQVSIICKQMTSHLHIVCWNNLVSPSPFLVLLCRASFDWPTLRQTISAFLVSTCIREGKIFLLSSLIREMKNS